VVAKLLIAPLAPLFGLVQQWAHAGRAQNDADAEADIEGQHVTLTGGIEQSSPNFGMWGKPGTPVTECGKGMRQGIAACNAKPLWGYTRVGSRRRPACA
jgi:hypothetical protein